tara:strand:+ start:3761 stop:10372 length:6612 start_codon:yes stop_codon:yes gene_type:complete
MATVAGSLRNKVLVLDDLTTGDLTVTGALTLSGTATQINSTNTTISDHLIELGSGLTNANTNDLGLILERGSTGNNVFIGWDESADKVVVATTTAVGTATGNLTLAAANFQAADISMSTGASSGKFAVMSSAVHGSYDFYNNGTSYFNGDVEVNAEFKISSSSSYITHFNYLDGGNNIISQANGGSTAIRNSNGNLFSIGSNGSITSTGLDHTFYSGATDIDFSIGRDATQALHINVDDGNIKLTADQDADANGTHEFILDRTFDGTGANNFEVRKAGSMQMRLDTNSNATFTGSITSNATSGSSFYGITLTRSSTGITTPDLWGSNNTLVLGTSSSEEVIGMAGSNATFYGDIYAKDSDSTTDPTISFVGHTDSGLSMSVSGGADQLSVITDGTRRGYINSAGITSASNVYTSGGGNFRNYGSPWIASTGVTGNGFSFLNSVDGTPMTISSTGTVTATADMRAPIFYDSSNTDFYVDPVGSSKLYGTLYLGHTNSQSGNLAIYDTGNNYLDFKSTGANAFSMDMAGTGSVGQLTFNDFNVDVTGHLQHFGTLYSRANLQVLNAASNGWNTWATRNNGTFDLTVGSVTSVGNSVFTGSGTSGNAFEIKRGANSQQQAFRVQNSGEVIVSSNYLYCTHTGVAFYAQGAAVFRGGITNDGGNDLSITSPTAAIDFNNKTLTDVAGVDVDNAGFVSFYGNGSRDHSIGAVGDDDIRINSYGSIFLSLDSNGNNDSAADFKIVKHAGGTSSWANNQELLCLRGDNSNGDLTIGGSFGLSDQPYYAKLAIPGTEAAWGGNGTTTGAVVIDLPGTLTNYDMLYLEIDVFEYNGKGGSKIIIGTHNWNSGANSNTSSTMWHNTDVRIVGRFDKEIYFGWRNDGTNNRRVIVLGNHTSSWSYATVHVGKVSGATDFYTAAIDYTGNWNITQTTSSSFYTKSPTTDFNGSDKRTMRVHRAMHANRVYADSDMRAPHYYDLDNTSYYTNPASTSHMNAIALADGIYHKDDLDTSINFTGNEQDFLVGGVTALHMDSSRLNINPNAGNYDFRVSGDSETNLIYADASADRVGIGTSAPSNLLSLKGLGNNWNTSPAMKLWDAQYSQGWYVGTANNQASGDYYIRSVTSESAYPVAANQQFTIKQNGNVGIGTIAPLQKLDVRGGNIFVGGYGGGVDYGMIFSPADGSSYWNIYNDTGGELAFCRNLTIGTSEMARFDSAGYLGIGTADPQKKLHISGVGNTDGIKIQGTGANTSLIIENDATNGVPWNISSTGGGHGHGDGSLQFGVSFAFPKVKFESNGNVAIGALTPEKNLTIGGAQAEGIQFNYDTTNSYRNQILNYWNSNADTRMDFNIARTSGATPATIMSVGYNSNVGIGTTTPGSLLDVAGEIRGTILKDRDNTGYYLDPSSTSNLNTVGVGKLLIDGKQVLDMNSNSTERGPWNPIVTSLRHSGRQLYGDEDFSDGTNSVNVYNNAGGGVVTHTREDATTNSGGNAPNSSGKVIRINHNGGTSSPGFGGFYQTIPSEDNHTFVQIFQAKLPVGKSVVIAENSQGSNATSYFLTNTAGTGKWEWYARVSHCGVSGNFHGGGHIYVSGGSGNFNWYLASCTCYDVTESHQLFNRQFIAAMDMRAPIFYDSNDTNYYIDAHGTSQLNSLVVNSSLDVNENVTLAKSGNGRGVFLNYNTSNSYRGYHDWRTLQFGNNGANNVLFGNTSANGYGRFYTNATAISQTGGVSGTLTMQMLADGTVEMAKVAPITSQINFTGAADGTFSFTNAGGGSAHYTNRAGRVLTSNSSGWHQDGEDPVISIVDSHTGTDLDSAGIGLYMHNEQSTNSAYSPGILFGSKSNSGGYNSMYGAIYGRKTGQGPDSNWNAGEMHFFTVDASTSSYVTSTPDLTLKNHGTAIVKNDVRTPIVYDSDNTSYYFNGATTGTSLSLAGSSLAQNYNVIAGAGNALKFWNGSTSYQITMASQGSAGYGRIAGETTSDYNMYFRMNGGTNRGFVFQNGPSTNVAGIDASGNARFTGHLDIGSSKNYKINNIAVIGKSSTTLRIGDIDENDEWGTVDILAMAGTGRVYIADGEIFFNGTSNGSAGFKMIGTTGAFHANNDIIAYSSTLTASDGRLKENVRPIESSLNKILTLDGVKFDWKDKDKPNDQLGFIAQDVEKVLPEVVNEIENGLGDYDGHKVVNYQAVVPVLVEAIKELKAEIDELKEQLKKK